MVAPGPQEEEYLKAEQQIKRQQIKESEEEFIKVLQAPTACLKTCPSLGAFVPAAAADAPLLGKGQNNSDSPTLFESGQVWKESLQRKLEATTVS